MLQAWVDILVPEPVDLQLVTRPALRIARARVEMTADEFAERLGREAVVRPGQRGFHGAWVEACERPGPVPVDLQMFLLGLRLAGLDLIATIEHWIEDRAVDEAFERPYARQPVPRAFRGLFSSRPTPSDIEELCRHALIVGRKRRAMTMTAAAAAITPLLPGPAPTRVTVSRWERGGVLRTLEVLAALQVYGLDLAAIVGSWIQTGRSGRVAR